MIRIPFKAAQFALLFCILGPSLALSEDRCNFFGEENARKFERSMQQTKSCRAAADLFYECRWGSSADVGFGAIAIEKCKQEYKARLTPAQEENLAAQIDLCSYQFARQEGTLSISERVGCDLAVAAAFAANPQRAAVPIPPASFDCNAAKSPLEKAICSDASLGRADVVLGRVYSSQLKFAKGADRLALIDAERRWLRSLPVQCGLTAAQPSAKTLACLRNEFELRFSRLDRCANDVQSCLSDDSSPSRDRSE